LEPDFFFAVIAPIEYPAMSRSLPFTSVIIDTMNDPEVQYWAKEMQIEKYELRAAIRVVGPRLTDLRRYFGKSAHIIYLENWVGTRETCSEFPPVA
jgi:hypothetical protein